MHSYISVNEIHSHKFFHSYGEEHYRILQASDTIIISIYHAVNFILKVFIFLFCIN